MCDNNWLGSSWSGDQGMEGSVTGFVPVTFSYNVSAGDAIMSNNDGMDSGCGCDNDNDWRRDRDFRRDRCCDCCGCRRRRNSCGCGCRRSRCCW